MSHHRRGRRGGNSSVWDPTASGDIIGTESGYFNQGTNEGENDNNNNNENSNVRGRRRLLPRSRQRGNQAAEAREYPPPLTTLVTHRDPSGPLPNVPRRFGLFRRTRTSEDGQRSLVIEAGQREPLQTQYHMRTHREGDRLTIGLENLSRNENEDENDDDDNDGGNVGGDGGNFNQTNYYNPPDYGDDASSSSSYQHQQNNPFYP